MAGVTFSQFSKVICQLPWHRTHMTAIMQMLSMTRMIRRTGLGTALVSKSTEKWSR